MSGWRTRRLINRQAPKSPLVIEEQKMGSIMGKESFGRVFARFGQLLLEPGLVHVLLGLLTIQSMFSGLAVIGKIALKTMHPLMFAFLREVKWRILTDLAGAVPKREDFVRIILLGVIGVFGNQLFVFVGLALTSPIHMSIMQCLIPVLCTSFALVLRMEGFHAWKLVGILVSASGACIMIGIQGLSMKEWKEAVGTLCLLTNATASALYIILQKPIVDKYPPVSLTGWAYLVGSVCMGLTLLLYNTVAYARGNTIISVWGINVEVALSLLYAIFGATICAYLLLTWCNKRANASLISATYTLQPFISSALAYVFLHQSVKGRQILGGAFVLTGLAIVLLQKHLEAKKLAEENALQQKLEKGQQEKEEDGNGVETTSDAADASPNGTEVELKPLIEELK